MTDYSSKELFLMDNVDKQLNISYDGGEITNSELASEDFTLTEKLTSKGDFSLGECNASYIEFSVGYGTVPLEGKKLTVSITPKDADPFKIGEYKVVSDKPTADRRWRTITAYDAMYDILNEDVTEWYNAILPDSESAESVTLKDFRDSFFQRLGVTQETVSLPNDDLVLTRTVDYSQLSGKKVINAICEINGCFGHIDRDGVFRYVFLHAPSDPIHPAVTLFPKHTLFPKASGNSIEIGIGYRYKYPLPEIVYPENGLHPEDDLYPVVYEIDKINGLYTSVKYEDYSTDIINAIQIRNDKNDIGVAVGFGNAYIIEGNFLVFGQSQDVLYAVAERLQKLLRKFYFCPADIEAQGNPCLEIGESVVLHTKYKTIETIVLNRKLKGIQSLKDSYSSKGKKEYKSNLNGTSKVLTEVEGKANEIKADLVETKRIVANELEAQSARIGMIEANYVKVDQLEAVDAKIENLSAIAITSQNIETVNLSASQITSGTIATARLNVGEIAAQTVTVNTISGACVSPETGYMTMGTVRCANLYWYTKTGSQGSPEYKQIKYFNDGTHNVLYVD